MTEAEFAFRTARALLPAFRDQTANFIQRVISSTIDPRLRNLVIPIPSLLEQNNTEAAKRWLDRALEYERARPIGRT